MFVLEDLPSGYTRSGEHGLAFGEQASQADHDGLSVLRWGLLDVGEDLFEHLAEETGLEGLDVLVYFTGTKTGLAERDGQEDCADEALGELFSLGSRQPRQ